MTILTSLPQVVDWFSIPTSALCSGLLIVFLLGLIKTDFGLVDIFWGIGFQLVLWTAFLQADVTYSNPAFWLLLMITVWGVRLSVYLFVRNFHKEEDWRYAKWRQEWGKRPWIRAIFQVYLLQGIILLLISLPAMVTIQTGPPDFTLLHFVGLVICLFGLLFESIGDYQLYRFKQRAENRGKIMRSGLWKYSRHPNYFGEAVFWWGVFIFSIPSGMVLLSLISPILLTYLLLRVSGVAMLERKWEGEGEWGAYKRRTSAFFPLPPKQNP